MSKFKPGDKVVLRPNHMWNACVTDMYEIVGHLPMEGEVLTVLETDLSFAKTGLFFTTCKVFLRPFGCKQGLNEASFMHYQPVNNDAAIEEDCKRLLAEATELIRLY